MDPTAIMIGLVLLGAAMVFVFRPLRARPRLALKNTTAALRPPEAHAVAIKALRDLDFDYRTGKVSQEDYSGLRLRLMAEAARYVEVESKEDDQLEALVLSRRQAIAHEKPCRQCGKSLSGDAQFCPHCGAKLAAISACPSCGKQVQAGDLFCRSCGSKLELRAEVPA